MAWQPPSITVKWGAYFAPDPTEQKAIVDMVLAALGGGDGTPIIPLRAAVEKIAPIFGLENIDAVMEKLEEEAEKRRQEEEDKAAREQQQMHELASGATGAKSGRTRGAGGGDAKATPSGGSGKPGSGAAST
jgi:hypothetical protein